MSNIKLFNDLTAAIKKVGTRVKTFVNSVPTSIVIGSTFLVGYITGSVMPPIQKQRTEITTSVTSQDLPSPKEENPPPEEESSTDGENSSGGEATPWYLKPEEVTLPKDKGTVGSGPDGPNPPGQ